GPARRSAIQLAPGVAYQAGRGRLLFWIFERRAVAAVPHRAYPPDLPQLRLEGLPGSEPAFRASRAGRDEILPVSGCAGAGLSLCASSPADQGGAAGCARGHLLAHSLAKCRSLPHLPLATGTAGRPA